MAKKAKTVGVEQKSPASERVGRGCLILFALPFALVGAGVAAAVAYDLWTWRDAQSWVETPATLSSTSLDEDFDSDGGASYKAKAAYAYEFNGRRFENDRVA